MEPRSGSEPNTIASPADLAKFTAMVALLAILSDAAIGHALQWENDPYWTYWITKTFLIATIFGLGTAWLGMGAGKGAIITAVHTLVLTVYYWSLSPIGLPSSPEWLDLEHTWITGIPIHFAVIYLGYLTALWVWRRRAGEGDASGTVGREASLALGAGAIIVLVTGAVEALSFGEFQGVTWYVVRLLIVVPFVMLWRAVAGTDMPGAISGAIVLTAIVSAYSHFLGPVGLPDLPLRIFETEAPGATAHWLNYKQEFLVGMPVTLAVAGMVLVVASRLDDDRVKPVGGSQRAAGVVAWILAVLGGVIAAVWVDPAGDKATVTASGGVSVERGSFFSGDLTAATGSLSLKTVDRNPRVTPLPPHDVVELTAEVRTAQGVVSVRATDPMVSDPLGRFTTWWGVGYDVWHHGRSGIGTSALPPVRSDVAAFALGSVEVDGEVVAEGVPVHVMTMDDDVELDVGQPGIAVAGLTDGHLRAVWSRHEMTRSEAGEYARYAYGTLVLLGLLVLVGAALSSYRSA